MCKVMCSSIKEMIDEGIATKAKKMAIKMYQNGDSIEKIAEIAEIAEVSMDQVKEWLDLAG